MRRSYTAPGGGPVYTRATMARPGPKILHHDAHVVAVDKPAGFLVHPSFLAGDRDTLMSRVRDHISRRVFPVHRLDRGVTGVVLFALDPDTARVLATAFESRTISKTYVAVVRGWIAETGTNAEPLSDESGGAESPASTDWRRLATGELPHAVGRHATGRYSLVEVSPLTGRWHQIRRHLARRAHPVIGDMQHGDRHHSRLFKALFGVERVLLHARRVAFDHPATGLRLTVEAPFPADFQRVGEALGWTNVDA